MSPQMVVAKRFPESMAGRHIGMLHFGPSYEEPGMQELNLVAALVGDRGAQLTRFDAYGPGDLGTMERIRTTGFVAVRGMRIVVPPQAEFDKASFSAGLKANARHYETKPSEYIENGVLNRFRLNDERREWFEDRWSFTAGIKLALEQMGLKQAYPVVYYGWNASMYRLFQGSYVMSHDYETFHEPDGRTVTKSYQVALKDVLLVDPEMAKMTAKQLALAIDIETSLGTWAERTASLCDEIRFFSEMDQNELTPKFVELRQLARAIRGDIQRKRRLVAAPTQQVPDKVEHINRDLDPGRKLFKQMMEALERREEERIKSVLYEEARTLVPNLNTMTKTRWMLQELQEAEREAVG